jgi:hypothetical protein
MYKLLNPTLVKRLEDGCCIPLPPAESEGFKYQAWLNLGNTPLPADIIPVTIRHLSPRQFRQALNAIGLRQTVETAISAADQNTKDWYEYSTYFDRQNPVMISFANQLGKTSADIDALWALGITL